MQTATTGRVRPQCLSPLPTPMIDVVNVVVRVLATILRRPTLRGAPPRHNLLPMASAG